MVACRRGDAGPGCHRACRSRSLEPSQGGRGAGPRAPRPRAERCLPPGGVRAEQGLAGALPALLLSRPARSGLGSGRPCGRREGAGRLHRAVRLVPRLPDARLRDEGARAAARAFRERPRHVALRALRPRLPTRAAQGADPGGSGPHGVHPVRALGDAVSATTAARPRRTERRRRSPR
jgi:hypothetical protein